MELNQIIEVNVVEVNPSYVKIEFEGRQATLQITELTWKAGKIDSSDCVAIGQKIRVKVIAIQGKEYSVSLREASFGGNPWRDALKVGEEYFAPLVGITEYGYFFEISYFCHALMLKENAPEDLQLGDRIKVKISSSNPERQRIEILPI